MGFNNEQVEKIAILTGLFLILIFLIYQVLTFIGLVPGIFCGTPCMIVFLGIGMVLSTYAVYRFGGKRDQKTNELLERSYHNSLKALKFTVIMGLVSILIVILVIGCAVVTGIYLQSHSSPSGSSNTGIVSPVTTVTPQKNIGHITIDQNKLVKNDPIVAIWHSTDAADINMPINTTNNILIIYNDNTLIIFDKVNNSTIEGTWEKTFSNDYYNEYTVHESNWNSVPTKMVYSSSTLQYVYTYVDNPPHSVMSYINYRLLDWYPLTPSTQAYLNSTM